MRRTFPKEFWKGPEITRKSQIPGFAQRNLNSTARFALENLLLIVHGFF